MTNFKKALRRYQESLELVRNKERPKEIDFADYMQGKTSAKFSQYDAALELLKKYAAEVIKSIPSTKDGFVSLQLFESTLNQLEQAHFQGKIAQEEIVLGKLAEIISEWHHESAQQNSLYVVQNIPDQIKPEILADIDELEKCFNADCLRSCVIICGRLLETALHRKYFETTGQDILEKNPGIGLGTLVAKLTEKGILLDPGLANMIHLINNVRIFTVHKKKEAFYPTKEQTQATMLFTLDVLRKLFSR